MMICWWDQSFEYVDDQVASLQGELAMVQTQLMNSRYAYASVLLQGTQQQPNINIALQQPAYSNNSSASTTNLMNMSCFNNPAGNFDLAMETTAPSSHSFEPLQQLSRLSTHQDEEEDEEESRISHVFNHRR